jgi:alkanesulfonate monooxygenase SsuD/methylene tetrahydromethanopterin reductase-like flavin-dependent oxidoreductase (luciferase family)
MRLGAYFLPVDFPVYLRSVKAADQAGYDTAWIPDSQMIWQDPYVYMARGLAETDRIVFGTAVTNAITRHFTVTASGHVTLAQMHPGRVVMGIGRGDSSIRTLGLKPLKVAQMRELVGRLRDLMAGEEVDLDGRPVRITFARDHVPVMVGGTGPRTMRMAGALADVVTVEVGASEDAIRWAVENIRRGAEEAGRDADEVQVVALCGMWVSDDREEARANCRWAPASAANHIAEVMHNNPEHGMPAALTDLVALRRQTVGTTGLSSVDGSYDYYGGHCVNDADHAQWIPDDVLDDFALAGTADEVVERIEGLARLGVDEVAAAFLNGHDEQMRLVGETVIPRLRSGDAQGRAGGPADLELEPRR